LSVKGENWTGFYRFKVQKWTASKALSLEESTMCQAARQKISVTPSITWSGSETVVQSRSGWRLEHQSIR